MEHFDYVNSTPEEKKEQIVCLEQMKLLTGLAAEESHFLRKLKLSLQVSD